jgi:YD repeat-containing protein
MAMRSRAVLILVMLMLAAGLTPGRAMAAPDGPSAVGGAPAVAGAGALSRGLLAAAGPLSLSPVVSRAPSWLDGIRDWIFGPRREEQRSGMRPGPAWSPPGRSGADTQAPKLALTSGAPSLELAVPHVVHATGAELSWRPYADPSAAEGDNLAEYQVHRSYQPNFAPSAATLVAPLSPKVVSYTDTTAEPAEAGAAQGRSVFYTVLAVRKDGQRVASPEVAASLPQAGHTTQVIKAQAQVADTTLSACQPTIGHDLGYGRTELVTGIQDAARSAVASYGKTRSLARFDTSAIPKNAMVTDAQLGLWRVQDSGTFTSMTVHPLKRGFDESATWNKATASTSWATPGGDFGPAVATTVLKSDPRPGWARFPVTATAQGWVKSPASNNGVLVKLASEPAMSCVSSGAGAIWTASESVEPGLSPYLQVTYTDPTLTYYAAATPSRLKAGETVTVPVTVTNTTATVWPAAATRLGYWWQRPDGTDATTSGSQVLTALPADLAPGQTVTVNATITAPGPSTDRNKAEAYTLAWDLLDTATNEWRSSSSHLPQLPQQIGVEDPTSDLLGLEDFYSYTGKATGAGSGFDVNNYAGNVVWSYDAFDHPSRGPDTSVAMTYNSMDTSRSSMGFGWSLHASTLQRLGSRLTFSPPGQTWPSQVRLIDGDGTTSVFTLDDHGLGRAACTPTTCDYVHPRGLHLYLQRTGSADPTRTWVFTAPDRMQFFFDAEGYQSAIVDKNDNTMSFVYEQRRSNNRPTKFLQRVVDAVGRHTLQLDWWTKGESYTYITDTGSEATGTNLTNPFIIDQLQSITDVAGRKITFTYTVEGLMAKMVDGDGNAQAKTFRFAYDATQGNRNVKLLRATDPRGHATRMLYYTAPVDPQDKWKLHELTDRSGGVTHFDYVDPDGPQGARIHTMVTDPEEHDTRFELDPFGRLERATDAKNQTTIFGFDDDNNLTRLEEPPASAGADRAVTTWTYDAATGFPLTFKTAEANANGWPATEYGYLSTLNGHVADLVFKDSPERRSWFYVYDPRGNLASVTDPNGSASPEEGDFTTRFEYDEFGQVIRTVDANGHPTVHDNHDATGQPQIIIDAELNGSLLSYDARGNLIHLIDPLGHARTWSYDLFGRLGTTTEEKDAEAADLIVTPAPVYDANDNVTEYTKANGAVYVTAFDNDDREAAVLEPRDGSGGPERRTSFTYDKVGNRLTVTEPNGNLTEAAGDYTTTFGYDEIYQLTGVRDAAGHLTSYHYDGAGNLSTVVDGRKNATPDPADYTTKFTYTRDHQVSAVIDAAGFSIRYGYDRDGLRTTVTDQNGSVTTTLYHPRGDVKETRVPHELVEGQVRETITRFEYDQVGNQTKVISPRGVATDDDPEDFLTEFKYDKANRLTEQIYPFDKDDNEVRNRSRQSVLYGYDAASRLISVELPAGDPAFSVDPDAGRIRSTTEYFDNGWIKKSTDPHGIAVSYDYNRAGEQTKRTVTAADGTRQRELAWDYFPDGKLRRHATAEGSTPPPVPEARAFDFTYDANGNLTTITDDASNAQVDRWELSYDQRNQIELMVEKLRGVTRNTGTYNYNENGAPRLFLHNSASAEFGYDERDLLASVRHLSDPSDPSARSTSYTYTPRTERATETKSNGNVARYEYFLDGLLRHSEEKKRDGSLVSEHTLQYQANLRRSRDEFKFEVAGEPGIPVQRIRNYSYDPRDRVSKVEEQNNPGQGAENYIYDANSNIIVQSIGPDTTHFLYDRNRLAHSGSAIAPRTTTYNYDESGRVRSVTGGTRESERYAYDDFDRIIEHHQLGSDEVMRQFRYAYDALGRTSATTDHTGKTTAYSYLGLTGEVLDERVGADITRAFEYSALGERLLQERRGSDRPGRAVYGYNSYGDVETLGGENGDNLATHGYSAYGVALADLTSGTDKIDPRDPYKEPYNPYWFHARRFDQVAFQATGTQDHQPASYHVGQRDYQPASHRFLTPDARSGAPGDLGLSLDPGTSNRYGFAGGTPATNVDYVGPFDWKKELTKLAVGTAVGLLVTALAGPVCAGTGGMGCVAAFWVAGGAAGAAASYGVDVKMDPNRTFDPGELALEATVGGAIGLLSFGVGRGMGSVSVRSARSARVWSCKGNSFTAGTAVLMADGTRKDIEDVEVGEKVLATDPTTGRTEAKPVTDVIKGSGQKQLVEITVDTDGAKGSATGKITATDRHPFWVADQSGWTDAEDLEPGDRLRTPGGASVTVVAVRLWTERDQVYNLTVDGVHTYYVGAGARNVLVHNCFDDVPDAPGVYEIYFKDGSIYVGSTPKGGTMRDRVMRAFSDRKHAVQAGPKPKTVDDILFISTIEAPSMGKYAMILAEQQRIHFHQQLGRTLLNRTNASGPRAWRKYFHRGLP